MTAINTDVALETGSLPGTPIGDTLLRRFLHNQADVDTTIAQAGAGGGRTWRDAEVSLADTGGPTGLFNQAILLRPLTGTNDPVLDRVESFYAADPGRPATLLSAWPTPPLHKRGWKLVGHPVFVARGPSGHPPPDPPPGVRIEIAHSPGQLAIAEETLVTGFPIDEAAHAAEGQVLPPGLARTHLWVRIGSYESSPCAMAGSAAAHGVVNLFIAATLPAARGRSVWRSLVNAPLTDAPDLPAVAFTSDDSRPGFERMGFLPITRFTFWKRQG